MNLLLSNYPAAHIPIGNPFQLCSSHDSQRRSSHKNRYGTAFHSADWPNAAGCAYENAMSPDLPDVPSRSVDKNPWRMPRLQEHFSLQILHYPSIRRKKPQYGSAGLYWSVKVPLYGFHLCVSGLRIIRLNSFTLKYLKQILWLYRADCTCCIEKCRTLNVEDFGLDT